MSEEVRLQEIITQKEARIGQLEADNERQSQEIKLLKEKVDLLIRRLFGAKSEKLDVAQLELLLKEADLGKADASAEKAEAAPITGLLKPVSKGKRKTERRNVGLKISPSSAKSSNLRKSSLSPRPFVVLERKSVKRSITGRLNFFVIRSSGASSSPSRRLYSRR